jgi:tetratricopeptide (TPR) repeat protein
MTDFTSVSIPQPKDWPAFERHSRVLFEYSLGDPHTQNNGRPGQRQHGVDIFGRRGGNGALVGVQCKGKDADYGGAVTEAELKQEVEKTKKFKPVLDEFILITTAPDDAILQEAARRLEEELRTAGRQLKIAVWGWGRLQQEITQFPTALKAFHPDASPFSDLLIDDNRQIKELLKEQHKEQRAGQRRLEDQLAAMESQIAQTMIAAADGAHDGLDEHIHAEINTYRDMIDGGRPRTAITLLTSLQGRLPANASNGIHFRILANIGTAHHRLGEFDTAAGFFLQAAPLNPEEVPSIANKIAALLIQKRPGEAHDLAVRALQRFPDSPEIALQRVQALGAGESIESVWSSLPPPLRENERLITYRVLVLRERHDPQWRFLLEAVYAKHPSNRQLRVMHAEAILDSVLSGDRAVLGAPAAHPASEGDLREAIGIFTNAWNDSLNQETPPDWSAAHNGALGYLMLGDQDAAETLLDAALDRGLEIEETKRMRVSLFVRKEQIAQAIALADTLSDNPHNRIYRADVRVKSDPSVARALLGSREGYTERIDVIASAQIRIDSYLTEGNFNEAVAEAGRLRTAFPDDAQAYLSSYRAHAARGDPDAVSFLEEAKRRIDDATDFVSRFLIAAGFARAGRFDDAVDLLADHVSPSRDSPALHELIAAAANADRRAVLKRTLEALPGQLLDRPFYRKAQAALAIRSGDLNQAERAVRSFLAAQPRSLEMHLQLLRILARREKLAELSKEVTRPASEFDGPPEDLISLAQFKEVFGSWQEAHDLAYRTWLNNQNNAAVNIRYVGVFLRPGHSRGLEISPPQVAENTAVCLRREDDSREVFVIEPDSALRPTPHHLAPTHRIAQSLLNQPHAAEIQFPDGSKAKIDWIKPKQLHALHSILEGYQNLFPESGGLERVPVKIGEPGGFQPIFDRVRDRHDAIEIVFNSYATGTLPIALIARALGGDDPVEPFISMIQSQRQILVCEGTSQEREATFAAIEANQKRGCVLDAITLHVVRSFGLERAVQGVCGPIGIVERTSGRIYEKIHELEERLNEPDRSLIWREGQIHALEIAPEEKRATLEALQRQKEWMDNELEIIPAHATRDPSPDLRRVAQEFASDFLDDIFAAESAGRLFVSEDKTLRALAQSEYGLRTTWLQPILMKAVDQQHITRDEYDNAIMNLIKCGFDFISADPGLLVWALHNTRDLALPEDFVRVAARLGGPKADLPSHVGVALSAVRVIWLDRNLSPTLRQAALGTLLENLSKSRPISHFIFVLRAFAELGSRLENYDFLQYLRDWLRGHFINLPAGSY